MLCKLYSSLSSKSEGFLPPFGCSKIAAFATKLHSVQGFVKRYNDLLTFLG